MKTKQSALACALVPYSKFSTIFKKKICYLTLLRRISNLKSKLSCFFAKLICFKLLRDLSSFAGLVFSLIFLTGCNDRLFDNPFDPDAETRAYEIISTIPIGNVVPVDITFSENALWVVDSLSRILAVDYNSGVIIRELDFSQPISGIAYDGKDLWLSINNSNQVAQINIVTGAQIRALNLLRGDLGCMAYAAERLYIADKTSNAILVVNPDSGAIEKTVSHPGFTINGLVIDGNTVWTIDATQNKLFRLDETGALLNVYQPPSRSAVGLTFAQGFIWCGDKIGKIYKLKFQ